jgi:hypothetical protein
MANAFVSFMQKLGHDIQSFGDSTGVLPLSYPKALTVTAEAGQ